MGLVLNFDLMAKPQVGTIVLVVALLLTSLAAGNFYMGMDKEQSRRIFLEEQLKKMEDKLQDLRKEKDELAAAKETLENQLNESTTKANELADQIAKEKRDHESQIADARRESTDLKTKLE